MAGNVTVQNGDVLVSYDGATGQTTQYRVKGGPGAPELEVIHPEPPAPEEAPVGD